MEKRNKLYYFESHDEIRDYMAQGFPSRVYLVARLRTVVKGDQVVHPANRSRNDNNGEAVPQWRINEGYVEEPRQTEIVTVLGTIDDFPADAFATRHDFRRHETEADTVLEGLYEVGDLLAARLRTANSERRTLFTAQELLKPVDKGGVWIEWPEGEQEVLYTVNTATGRYQMCESQVFEMVDRMERVEGVGPAKRHRFAIQNATAQQRDIVARLQFEADKMLPKLKKCWADEGLRPNVQQAAIEVATGVAVSTDGHVLVAHKTKAYKADVTDGRLLWDMVFLPREIVQMKGTITVEVELNDGREQIVTATDGSGRHGEVMQSQAYPNWRSVIPQNVGKGIRVDVKPWEAAVKQVLPHLCQASNLMYIDAGRGSKTITFKGEDYDFSKTVEASVQAPTGVNGGLWVGVKATSLLTMLGFQPDVMHFTDRSRALLFHNDQTLSICMPMLIDGLDEPRGPEKMERFSLEAWEKKTMGEATTKKAKPKAKQAAGKIQTPPPTPPLDGRGAATASNEPTFAERLREALLKHYRQAA